MAENMGLTTLFHRELPTTVCMVIVLAGQELPGARHCRYLWVGKSGASIEVMLRGWGSLA